MQNKLLNPKPTTLSKKDFVTTFGGVYEHSPWVAEGAYEQGLSSEQDTAEGLSTTMAGIVDTASYDLRLKLLRAHPELAGKLAVEDKLTDESKSEQSSAGLDKCTPEEFERFQTLNTQYNEKFGFPFIIAVRGLTRHDILKAFEKRVNHTPETEFTTALSQVHKIARLRLADFV